MPREDGANAQMTTFILLSDVTDKDGPTKVVPLRETRNVPIGVAQTKFGTYFDKEVSVEGPAGSLMVYKTDVFHRGSNFTAPNRSRFAVLADFKTRAWRWQGKLAWPDESERPVLGRSDDQDDSAPARPVRLAADRQRLLERANLARRADALSEAGSGAVSNRMTENGIPRSEARRLNRPIPVFRIPSSATSGVPN